MTYDLLNISRERQTHLLVLTAFKKNHICKPSSSPLCTNITPNLTKSVIVKNYFLPALFLKRPVYISLESEEIIYSNVPN